MSTNLFARLLLVFNLVLPNLVCAKVAVVKVSGAVVRGMKAGTGLGEPLNELVMGVGEGADEEPDPWPLCWLLDDPLLALLPNELGNGDVDLGLRLSPPSDVPTASIGLKHWASGLNVLVTSRSAELSSCGSPVSE